MQVGHAGSPDPREQWRQPWAAAPPYQSGWPHPPGGPGQAWAPAGPARPSPWAVVAAAMIGGWTVAVTVATQVTGWLVDQVLLFSGLDQPAWIWPLVAVVTAAAVGAPAALLAFIPRSAAVRASGRAWLTAAILLVPLGSLRSITAARHELYLVALAVTAAVAALLLRRLGRRSAPAAGPAGQAEPVGLPPAGRAEPVGVPPAGRAEPVGVPPAGRGGPALGFAIAAGLALLLPWAWVGALGGLTETLLAVAAAAGVGWLAATVLNAAFWSGFQWRWDGRESGAPILVLVGGLAAGVALLLLAAAVGHSGTHLATVAVLPATAFAGAALWRLSRPIARGSASYQPTSQQPAGAGPVGAGPVGPVGWLVALAVAGPLAFTDPEEINLALATVRDVPYWVALGTGGALAVALLLAIGYGVGLGRRGSPLPRPAVSWSLAAVLLIATAGVYVGPGQPGLHGERLFVVLREQADLSGISTERTGPSGRVERADEVYQRLVSTARRSQADLRRDLNRLGLDHTPYYLVNAVEVDGGEAVRAWLSTRPEVARVLTSQRVRPLPAAAPTARGSASAPTEPTWNLAMIGADRVWSQLGVDGSGIVVGGSDSGADPAHPALAGGYRGGDDSWHDPWDGTREPNDQNGHGTHTLATAVGAGDVGVAPGAQWIACTNLDRNFGNPALYLDCLQFMLAPFPPGGDPFTDGSPRRAPQVLTNSWGCPRIEGCDVDALRPAVAALAVAGVFFVAAAGNTGPYCGSIDDPPAPYAETFTVGAVDSGGAVTEFSSRGPAPGGLAKPDVVAPGAGVLSAMPGGGYATLDGTSMAAPHVAGVVALMWSANPHLIGDVDRTRDILRATANSANLPESAEDTDDCGRPAHLAGAGVVDAYAAVRAAQTAGGR